MPATYARRLAISEEGDGQQDVVIASVERSGFSLDWTRILPDDVTPEHPVEWVERGLLDEFRRPDFRDTVGALALNGRMIAALIQRKHEELAGFQTTTPTFTFAEDVKLFTPDLALAYWQRVLGIKPNDLTRLLLASKTDADPDQIAARVTTDLVSRVQQLYEETIQVGLGFPAFKRQALELMPDASQQLLQTEYRTKLTTAYGTSRQAQIVSRANAFPFTQFMAIKDGRTTWWICLPMGTAGPGGRGYIAATLDPVWEIWTPPNHWQCRSDLSPISYREAQRMGILAADGITRIAIKGGDPDRPFGDPPAFATHPTTGAKRRVEPQEGFGL